MLMPRRSLLWNRQLPVKDVDKLLQACSAFRNLHMRKILVDRLAQDFPNTWEGWVDRENQCLPVFGSERGIEFEALVLCRNNRVYQCIPALLYMISARYSQVSYIPIVGYVGLNDGSGRMWAHDEHATE